MSPALFLLLMLGVGRCNNAHIFGTKTVTVGEDVSLTCVRQHSWISTNLFWVRLVSGNFPEILGSTISHDMELVNVEHRITVRQEPGAFVLHITKTQLSDTAVYYCIKVHRLNMVFLNGTFLRIKGPEPDITAIIQDPLYDPVHPGDSVTLQCSVLSSSGDKACLEERRVYWFSARPEESRPHLVFAQKNSSDDCEKSLEARSPQKCVYSFSKNVSSSDAGTYYCAVAACGEMMFGNGTKLEIQAVQMCDVHTANTAVFLLSAALALSLIIIASLLYYIKKKKCDTREAAVTQETNAESASGFTQRQEFVVQRYEDSLVYFAPKFTRRKAGKAGRLDPKPAEEETFYSDVRIH